VAKPELGTKRVCTSCSVKFYDLSKNPIVCPKCHTVMELSAVSQRAPRPEPVAAVVPRAAAPVVEEALVPETQDADFVSLEEADAEAQGKKVADTDVTAETEDDIEIDETLDDAALIEEQEESDEDVTDIIGERENEEEP
jgi:uncharacterized protein (TIGR02300 family)